MNGLSGELQLLARDFKAHGCPVKDIGRLHDIAAQVQKLTEEHERLNRDVDNFLDSLNTLLKRER